MRQKVKSLHKKLPLHGTTKTGKMQLLRSEKEKKMASLYDIDKRIMECLSEKASGQIVDLETGEIIEVMEDFIDYDKLDALLMERQEKIEGVALWYKNLLADAEALKKEKQAFEERQRKVNRKAEQLKGYLSRALDGEKLETTRVKIAWRQSDQVICDDFDQVPAEYLRIKAPELDKAAAKKALKAGKEVAGCHLEMRQNIQIK